MTEAAKLAGAPGGRQRIFKDLRYKGTHRPAMNRKIPPLDGSIKTFERDDALWSDDASSDVVPSEDSSIRLALDQSACSLANKASQNMQPETIDYMAPHRTTLEGLGPGRLRPENDEGAE